MVFVSKDNFIIQYYFLLMLVDRVTSVCNDRGDPDIIDLVV